ncbi:DNA repair protein recO [Spiroplasma helicoides]|uniref:DNA repair protein RecO n=1 Tax=Spiroplasma helicoides TaxID=216938 RepID=A0A1B3SL14_9MOLU|nr:DNA repair protein RecO [Spiroplasma helicoides]AOG60619.1 DNA repair protein recO [Spiroplasma helicoides]
MSAIKIEGIVINSYDYRDYDKVIKVFSKEFGILSFYAPGVNKESSKNKYSIQTYSLSEFEIFKSRGANRVSKLKTGNLKKEYFGLAKNYTNYIYISVITSIFEQLLSSEEKSPIIYKAFKIVLENISNSIDVFKNYVIFLLFFIQNTNYKFNLEKCSRCKKSNYEIVRFEFSDKTLICKKCLWPGEKIQPETFVNIFTNFNRHTFHYLIEKKYEIHDLVVLHNFLLDYYENELGIYISASKILKQNASTYLSEENINKYK